VSHILRVSFINFIYLSNSDDSLTLIN